MLADREDGDAVMAAIRRVQKPALRVDLDFRRIVLSRKIFRQR